MSHLHLMGRLLHSLRKCGAALVAYCLGRYVCTRPDGDHDGQVIRGYLFNYLQPIEPVLETCGSPGTALSQKAGAGAAGAHGGPGAARAGRREPEPRGHVAAPKLP
jgi:hypothetical protein